MGERLTEPLNMSLSEAAAMPATSLPALALRARMSSTAEVRWPLSRRASRATGAASALKRP